VLTSIAHHGELSRAEEGDITVSAGMLTFPILGQEVLRADRIADWHHYSSSIVHKQQQYLVFSLACPDFPNRFQLPNTNKLISI